MLGMKALMRGANNMQMICGNTQAELKNDKFVSDVQERAQHEWEAKRWKLVYNWLLQGKKVHENGSIYSLEERMANEYPDFNTFVDMSFDFIGAYKSGELEPSICNLIEREASVLASVIVGGDYE